MPGENSETVQESINFLKSLNLDFKQYQWTYALPIPGSHLYEFAKTTGIIENEDKYLSSLTGKFAEAGVFHVNLTDEPDEVVAGWGEKVNKEIDDHYFMNKYKIHFIAKVMQLLKENRIALQKREFAQYYVKENKATFDY